MALHVTDIQRVSTDNAGIQGNGNSTEPTFSPDGSKVLFVSGSNALVADDTNGVRDIFIKDLVSGVVTRINTDSLGNQGNGHAYDPIFSPDGSKVAFGSFANNLVAGDTNGEEDIFVKDLATGIISRVSTSALGNQTLGSHNTNSHVFSPDGSKIAFVSSAGNLVAGDTNPAADVFIKDIATGAIAIVSTNAVGEQGNSGVFSPVFSPDGSKIAFVSTASNLVAGDTNGKVDVFVKDLTSGVVTRISTDSLGNQVDSTSPFLVLSSPVFSPDGSKLMFESMASNLVADDTNNTLDLFIKDLTSGSVSRISTNSAGNQITANNSFYNALFSPDGDKVVFQSDSFYGVGGTSSVYVKDLSTGAVTLISSDGAGNAVGGTNPSFSPDGNTLVFESLATNLVTGDTNNRSDIFIATLADDGNIPGTSASDSLSGSDGDDTINGFEGNDRLFGGLGNDSITGDEGRDRIEGNEGNDTIEGGIGNDTIRGGDDDDSLLGGSGDDTIYGDGGDDYINGGNSADSLQGGDGNDTLYGGSAADLLRGGDGNDVAYGESGADDLRMGAGDDTLNGGSGIDKLYGEAGADQFVFDAQAFSAVDRVKDFSLADGDTLLLSGILIGFNPATSAITDFAKFTNSTSGAQLLVDRDGAGASYGFERIAVIEHLTGQNAQDWYDGGNLVVA